MFAILVLALLILVAYTLILTNELAKTTVVELENCKDALAFQLNYHNGGHCHWLEYSKNLGCDGCV